MEAIFERRSIRKYLEKPISKELILDLLKAGMYAPTACNQRPWEFLVIDNPETLLKITEVHPYSQMLKEAPVCIAVCCNKDRTNKIGDPFWDQDCAAATENILLEAQDKGLGAVWLGVYPKENLMNDLKRILGIPENVIPFALISLGYPAEKPEYVEKFDSSRVYYNDWKHRY
ncbi:nitroreductase family protein [Methanococcus voltae]|uniref:Nitroreductase n=2 Tax=Methanococcus voltae TaxID=2188 RepID=A0A8J7URG0_METVO|nr:nitroreductase family protein [Methanococcus voltae]MBP2172827.1 nitroreductase [Methanococcus voltae]MBP2201763.1 nitroreductase [Methanococcus voltae]MCS3922551.1 nitroreductase [Methanococcus voltae PS]